MIKLILIVFVIIFFFWYFNKPKENFGNIMGAAAPYQEVLVNCLNQCEGEDPTKRFLYQTNMYCNTYCDFIVTDMQQRGIPPEDFNLINFSLDTCELKCNTSTDSEKNACLGLCYSEREVAKWCKEMECPYSLFDDDDCMKMCTSSKNTNNTNMRWNWSKN